MAKANGDVESAGLLAVAADLDVKLQDLVGDFDAMFRTLEEQRGRINDLVGEIKSANLEIDMWWGGGSAELPGAPVGWPRPLYQRLRLLHERLCPLTATPGMCRCNKAES